MGVGMPSQEVVLASWEGCVGLCLGGAYYLACLPWGVMTLPCLGGPRGWGELFLSLCKQREVAWEELTSSEGRCTAPGRELLPSLGGRWAIARLERPAWCLDTGRAVAFRGRVYSCQGRIASFPGRKVSNGWGRMTAYSLTDWGGLTAYYLTVSLG